MRTYVLAPEAEADLASQIDYLTNQGAFDAADRLMARVETFLSDFLCAHPATGRRIAERELWETWIPRTRLVVWYRFTDDQVQVARFWHVSRDRYGPPR